MWLLLLRSVFTGKAQEVYSSLSIEQSSNYDVLKDAVMKAYELVPEAYRHTIRDRQKEPNETYVDLPERKRICLTDDVPPGA